MSRKQHFLESMNPLVLTFKSLTPGTMLSAMDGEPRLQSDWALSQDPHTSCAWSKMINNQTGMQKEFVAAFQKLSLRGQDPALLTDCSALLTLVPPAENLTAETMYPPGFGAQDIVGQVGIP